MDRVGFGGEYPSPALVVTRFGSWRQALIAAGLEPGNPPPATKEAIIDALRSFHASHGQSPTTSAWRAERQFPVSETIIRHCGSWRAALELAGLPPPDRTRVGRATTRYSKRCALTIGSGGRRRQFGSGTSSIAGRASS